MALNNVDGDSTEKTPPPGQRSLAKVVVRGTVWVTMGNYVNQLIGFVSTLVLTRLLSPDIFGAFALASFWYGLLNIRSKIGLNYAAIQAGPITETLLGTYFILDLGSAVCSVLLTVLFAWISWFSGFHDEKVAVIACILMFIDAMTSIVGPYAIALEKEIQVSRTTIVTLIANLIAYPIAIGFAMYGIGIWSLLVINFCTYSVSMVGAYWLCKRRLPGVALLKWRFDRVLAKQLLQQGISTGISLALLGIIVGQFDNFLIGKLVSERELGYYDRAYRLANWTNVLFTAVLGRIGFLTMAKVKEDAARLQHTVRLSIWGVLMMGIPMALVLCFAASEIVAVLYGPNYAVSAHFLRVLAITNFMWTLISVGFWLSVSLGHQSINFRFSVIQAIILVIVATPLTILYGSTGTLVGVVIAMSVALILYSRYTLRTVSLSLNETFLRTGFSAIVTIGVLSILVWQINTFATGAIFKLLLIMTTTALTFGICVFLFDRKMLFEQVTYLSRLWQRN